MSGGVDSSVTALLLKKKHSLLAGVFLNFWKDENSSRENNCCSTESLFDAKRVCQKLSIPLYTLDFTDKFKREVVDEFISYYSRNLTPNPCITCNKKVKIGYLIKRAKQLGYDCVATGHYAIIRKTKNGFELHRAADRSKDQSYFLYRLGQEELSRLLLPLGKMLKTETRRIAAQSHLSVAKKKDSQEICFIGPDGHNPFLKRHLDLSPGDIRSVQGEVVGRHDGLPLYTIGQRRGIEIGGTGPYYVCGFDPDRKELIVTNDPKEKSLYCVELIASDVHWISGQAPSKKRLEAVIRYRHEPCSCQIELLAKGKIKVTFLRPQRAVTPGQSIVFYDKTRVLGGGIINP